MGGGRRRGRLVCGGGVRGRRCSRRSRGGIRRRGGGFLRVGAQGEEAHCRPRQSCHHPKACVVHGNLESKAFGSSRGNFVPRVGVTAEPRGERTFLAHTGGRSIITRSSAVSFAWK